MEDLVKLPKLNLADQIERAKKILERDGYHLSMGERMILKSVAVRVVNHYQKLKDRLIGEGRLGLNVRVDREVVASYLINRLGMRDRFLVNVASWGRGMPEEYTSSDRLVF